MHTVMKLLAPALFVLLAPRFVSGQTPRAANTVSDTPAVRVDMTTQQIGMVKRGESPKAEFQLNNVGTGDLHITKVFVPCSCILAVVDKTISPGAAGHLAVNLDTSALLGPIAKAIYVSTDDPVKKVVKLYIVGTIVPRLTVSPGSLVDVSDVGGQQIERTLLITSAEVGFAPTLKSIADVIPDEGASRYTTVEIKATQAAERKAEDASRYQTTATVDQSKAYSMKISIRSDAPSGEVNEQIMINTGLAEPSTSEINVVGVIERRYTAIPESITFAPFKATARSAPSRNIVFVSNSRKSAISIEGVELVTLPGFVAEVIPIDDGHLFNIVLTAKTVKVGLFDGIVRVKVVGDDLTIDVPVHAQVL
jgi:Protein of unknown function (DUF1573)